MKSLFYSYIVIGYLLTSVCAQDSVELTTLDGNTYSTVKVVRVENGQAILSHSAGIASIDLANLPRDFREANGLLPGLDETRAQFQSAVQIWISGYEKLNTQYEKALLALEKKFETDGASEAGEAVKTERESFRNAMQSEVSTVEELAKLQNFYRDFKDKWDRENSPQLAKINDTYLRTLAEVMQRKTREDKMDEASAIKDEITKFSEVAGDSDQIQILLGMGPAIVRVESSVVELSPDGNPSEKYPGTMAVMTAGPQMEMVLPMGDQVTDIVEMEGNWETWAALKSDGSLVSSPLKGDGIPEDHEPIIWFRVGAGVVLAFHSDGTYSVYGETNDPEDTPPSDLKQVTQLEFDRGSGIALSQSGKIRVWGKMYPSEQDRETIENQFQNVRFIGASEKIAWVVDESNDVYYWQNGQQPKKLGHHDTIASFAGGRSDYLVLLEDDTLEGGRIGEGESPIFYVPENLREGKSIRVDGWGYALQFKGGAWFTWGGPPESASLHTAAKSAGALLDLEICAAPGRFMVMLLRRR